MPYRSKYDENAKKKCKIKIELYKSTPLEIYFLPNWAFRKKCLGNVLRKKMHFALKSAY